MRENQHPSMRDVDSALQSLRIAWLGRRVELLVGPAKRSARGNGCEIGCARSRNIGRSAAGMRDVLARATGQRGTLTPENV